MTESAAVRLVTRTLTMVGVILAGQGVLWMIPTLTGVSTRYAQVGVALTAFGLSFACGAWALRRCYPHLELTDHEAAGAAPPIEGTSNRANATGLVTPVID